MHAMPVGPPGYIRHGTEFDDFLMNFLTIWLELVSKELNHSPFCMFMPGGLNFMK